MRSPNPPDPDPNQVWKTDIVPMLRIFIKCTEDHLVAAGDEPIIDGVSALPMT